MWELDHKESWAPKKWCFWTVVLEKTLESPSDFEEIQPVHPKGNQSWIFIGMPDAEAEAPILCHLMWRTDSFEKTLMLGKIEGRRRRGQQRMRWHQWLNGQEFEQAPGVGDGQGSLVCCSPWCCKESDTTEQLNWTELSTHLCSWWWWSWSREGGDGGGGHSASNYDDGGQGGDGGSDTSHWAPDFPFTWTKMSRLVRDHLPSCSLGIVIVWISE